ncbi:MAG: hypothetical protein M3Y08_18595 [Fibrobacterota bacterium]|nr:hypothetical protein [Fibrobacterota bacterium]
MIRPELTIPFLMTGYYQPGNKGDPFKSMEPVGNRYFVQFTKKLGPLFFSTDSIGKIQSVKSDLIGHPALAILERMPIHILLLPPGLVQSAFLKNPKKWQKNLLDEIIKQGFPNQMETIPVQFESKHLRVPLPFENEEKKAYDLLKSGGPYSGHLIPKSQILSLVVPSSLFEVDLEKPNSGVLSGQGLNTTIEPVVSNPKREEKIPPGFTLFNLINTENSIAGGKYQFQISGDQLNLERFPKNHILRKIGLKFSLSVNFSIRSLLVDADLHVLQPMGLEQAIMMSFPESYAYLEQMIKEKPGSEAEGKGNIPEAVDALKSFVTATKWMNEKRNIVTGLLNAEESKFWMSFCKVGWKEFSGSFDAKKDETSEKIRKLDNIWNAYWTGKDIVKKWETIRKNSEFIEENREGLKKIAKAWDDNLFKRLYHGNRWQRYLIKATVKAKSENKPLPALASQLVRADVSVETARKLMHDGIPKELSNMDHLLGSKAKVVGKSLLALDVAISLWSVYSTLEEISDLGADYNLAKRRLAQAFEVYRQKYSGSLNHDALRALESLRLLTDASQSKLHLAQKEAVLKSVEWVLGVATVFPVVGEFAALGLLGKAGVEFLGNVTASVGATLDEYYFSHYFARMSAQRDQFSELQRAHTLNAGALTRIASGKKPEELFENIHVQHRLRLAALIGLLRLVQRCGSRTDSVSFQKRVKDLDIQGYLETFFLAQKKGSIPLCFDQPLDMLWTYSKPWRAEKKKDEPGFLEESFITQGIMLERIPLSYRRFFPIYFMDSDGAEHFARVFSRDYSASVKTDKVRAHVCLREQAGEKWVLLADWSKPILPYTGVRLILEVEGKGDLAGVPISLRLIRKDLWFDNEGPLYKGVLVDFKKVYAGVSDEQSNLDMLLNHKSRSTECFYGCEFIPCYFYKQKYYEGLKPFGPLGMRTNLTYQVKFKAVIGGVDYPVEIQNGPVKTLDFLTVSMPLQNPVCVDFLLRSEFLLNRTSGPSHEPLFIKYPQARKPMLLCAFAKQNDLWHSGTLEESLGGLQHKWTLNFKGAGKGKGGFNWGKPFEMVFLVGAPNTTRFWEDREEKRIPAILSLAETTGLNRQGPQFPIEFHALFDTEGPKAGSLEVAEISEEMARLEIFPQEPAFKQGRLQMQRPLHLFAARFTSMYWVQDASGGFPSYEGLKPFSRKMAKQGNDHWEYLISIQSDPPSLGLELNECLELIVDGIPDTPPAGREFLGNETFITDEGVGKSKRVHRVDFER